MSPYAPPHNPFESARLSGVSLSYQGLKPGRAKGARLSEKTFVPPEEVHGIHVPGLSHEGHDAAGAGGHGGEESTWIYSFADLIMNLLMFFVMMFAISTVDKSKLSQVQEAFSAMTKGKNVDAPKQASGAGPGSGTGVTPNKFGDDLTNSEILEQLKLLVGKIDQKKLAANAKNIAELNELKPQLKKLSNLVDASWKADPQSMAFEIIVPAKRLFGVATSKIVSAGGKKLLSHLAGELNASKKNLSIQVRSYLPTSDGKRLPKPEAMSLSSERAAQVLDELARLVPNTDPTLLSSAAYASLPMEEGRKRIAPEERVSIRIATAPLKEDVP